MAAQVEVQTAEVGRTVAGGRHHLTPLTDSSNKSLIDIPSVNQPHLIASEPNKSVPSTKPRLTPKPFSVEKNPTIKPILAPKPQTKPRPESTHLAGYKPELPSNPKPQQPVASSKPRPVSTNPNRPASTSFKSSTRLNTGQTTKPVVQPFKPAPPLDTGDPSRPIPPVPAERQKPSPSSLAFSKSFKKLPAAEWSGTTEKEDEKGQNAQGKGGTSLTRAKSMGFLLEAGQDKEGKEKAQPETSVPLRPHPRGSRPRPVSAIFPSSPTKTDTPVPAPRWVGRRPLSADLTAKFESVGLSLHRKVPEASTKENTPEGKALPQMKEEDKTFMSTTPQSTDDVCNPILSDQSNKNKEEMAVKEADEDKRGVSIKSRISLLLDLPSSPGVAATSQGSEPRSPVQPTPETEPPVGVKQLIKQLTEDTTPTQSPVLKPALKPRPLPLDLTKRFSAERSPDPVSLTEALDHHDLSKDPQKRPEESAITPSDQKTFLDLKDSQEQLKKVPMPEGPEAGQTFGAISKESGTGSGIQTVRASLFDNVVERHSVLMMDEGSSVNMAKDLLSSPSPFKRPVTLNGGTLVTANYSQPLSPSCLLPVLHAFDTVQAVEESRAVSESVPSALWEDKAMTLRSRRSEGSRPLPEWTGGAEEQLPLAMMPETQPRYLRIGALQKWTTTGLHQDIDMEKGMLKESQREGQVALDKDREKQRVAEQEEVAAAPKRLKMLQADEMAKPRATYFALTGQIQEPVSLGGAGTNTGDMTGLFDDSFGRSVLGGPQGKSLPVRGSPSLDDFFGKTTPSQEQVEELMKSHQPPREIRSALDGQSKEERIEAEKKRQQRKEKERHKAKMKEVEREIQKQLEIEKQAHLEFARMKERDIQREFERQRQKAFEKEKQELEEKQRALERQKQIELEKAQELEREKQRLEREKQRKLEKEKQRELERQREIEREKMLERERQSEKEQQKQKEEEQLRELERLQELERQQLLEFQRQKQKEKEMQQLVELEKQKQKQKKEKEEAEKLRQMALEQEMLRIKELEKERERQMEMEKEHQREMEREKQREVEKRRQRDLERERQRQQDIERWELENQRMRQQELEKERKRKEDLERLKELERLQLLEYEKQKQAERERQQIVELEKQRQLDIERQELENQRLRQQELEKERKRKEDLERLKELERLQLLEYEKQKQAERERQQIVELEKRRLREKMEREEAQRKEEAERMRVIAKKQEAERQRLKEKQRKEEQERLKLESSPLRPKVVDLDSVLRNDPMSKSTSQRSDAATRWKEPYKPAILDIDSFTSQAQLSPNKDLFPLSGIQGLNADFGGKLHPAPESDVSWKIPSQTSVGFSSPIWTTPPQDPWELWSVEMSVDQSKTESRRHANKHSPEQLLLSQEERIPTQQMPWSAFLDESLHLAPFPRTEVKSGNFPGGLPSRGEAQSQRRSQGSQALNRLRSRSVSRRSAPASNAAEGSLSRMRSRSAHREQDRHSWVQQKQSVSGDEEGKDSETPVRETDSQYGTWETGLRTDDSLTPATPSSESNLSPSPRKPTPAHTPGDHASPFESDTLDGLPSSSSPESQPLSFPDAPTTLLDTSVLRSRAQLGKKRAPRTRPTRAARQNAAQAEGEGGTTEDWLYRDSTEAKAETKDDDSDSEEQPKGADAAPAVASQPQRVALFPGMDPSALKAQLKKRGDSDNQIDGSAPSPSQLSRSPKSPFLPRAARVLPPSGGKENGEEDSPQWLKELKSKKRLSQYENES